MTWIEGPVRPLFKSFWLTVHIGSIFMGNGLFAIAFLVAVMYLVQERQIKRKQLGPVYSRLPSLASLDLINYQALIYGFPLMTVGMITGSVYAQVALGTLLAVGPQGGVVAHHLAALRGPAARKAGGRLARPAGRDDVHSLLPGADLHLCGRKPLVRRLPQLQQPRGPQRPMTGILNIGMNHETAPVELRECLAAAPDSAVRALERMRGLGCIREAFFLSTCNRVEAVCITEPAAEAEAALVRLMSELGKIPEPQLAPRLYAYRDAEAVAHVFRVASSLDSMVVGEPQILGQIKEAYLEATRRKTSGVILNRLMHRAFHVAKRVRSETGICGCGGVHQLRGHRAGPQDLPRPGRDKQVLLIGAGEMAELAARHLKGAGSRAHRGRQPQPRARRAVGRGLPGPARVL